MIYIKHIIKLSFKRYTANKFTCISTLLFFCITIIYTLNGVYNCYAYNSTPLEYLCQSLNMSIFTFVFFLLISYEFMFQLYSSKTNETIISIKSGFKKYYFSSILICTIVLFVYQLTHIIINLTVYYYFQINHIEYQIHIFLNIIVNIFIIPFVGIVFGALLSRIRKKVISYFLILTLIFLSTPLFEVISLTLYDDYEIYSFGINDFFNFFPPLLNWAPLESFGYSLLSYRICLICFWLFLYITILYCTLEIKTKKRIIAVFLSIFICGTCLIEYFLPVSKVTMDNNPVYGVASDAWYYGKRKEINEQLPNFSVKSYDMKINIDRNLKVNATLTLSTNNLETYYFTLYHGYKIIEIGDKNGKTINFKRDGDIVEIHNNSDYDLSNLTFIYFGSCSRFYSNSQGTVLPGWFAYYPHAGILDLYDESEQAFNRVTCENDTDFQLEILCKKDIYCNLNQINDTLFKGKTDGVSIVSGFYQQTNYCNIQLIYPYLETNEFNNKLIREGIDNLEEKGIIDKTTKYVIIIPNVNISSPYEKICKFSNCILMRQFTGIDEDYNAQGIDNNKIELFYTINCYKESKDLFNELIEMRKEYYKKSSNDINQDIYILLDNKIKEFGEQYVIDKTNKYLRDDCDNRNPLEFLNEL